MLSGADKRFKSYLVEFVLTPTARTKVRTHDKEKNRTNSTNSSLTDLATHYATQVVSDVEQLAGPDIRHACQRHLRDLSTGNAQYLVLDIGSAQRAIRFFPTY